MITATIELPTGAELQRKIADIEARTNDERIRKTIASRVVLADDPATVFVSHEEVFAQSRARLMARLSAKANA